MSLQGDRSGGGGGECHGNNGGVGNVPFAGFSMAVPLLLKQQSRGKR